VLFGSLWCCGAVLNPCRDEPCGPNGTCIAIFYPRYYCQCNPGFRPYKPPGARRPASPVSPSPFSQGTPRASLLCSTAPKPASFPFCHVQPAAVLPLEGLGGASSESTTMSGTPGRGWCLAHPRASFLCSLF